MMSPCRTIRLALPGASARLNDSILSIRAVDTEAMSQEVGNVLGNPLFPYSSFSVQRLQFLVQLFKAHRELIVVCGSFSHAHVTAWIEAPSLPFDVGKAGDVAQPENIGVLALREFLLHHLLASRLSFDGLAPVQTHDVGDELNLLTGELPVCPVDLAEDVACVD